MRPKPLVVTIHGIRTRGDWQTKEKGIGRLLSAYFDHRPFHYDEYQHPVLGLIRLALVPLAMIVGFGGMATVAWLILAGDWPWYSLPSAILGAMCLNFAAHVIAEDHLDVVVRRLKTHLGVTQPSIIAHSLGCFLVGTVLRRFADVHVGRIVFAGSVLSPDFAWNAIRGRFSNVRNEVDREDWVPGIARWLCPFFKDLGTSGASGFLGSYVRDGCAPASCPKLPDRTACDAACRCLDPEDHYVQNVDVAGLTHSGWFVGNGHVVRFWLPYLWGLPISRYIDFVDLCAKCIPITDFHWCDPMARRAVNEAERRLGQFCWGWVSQRHETLSAAARRVVLAFCAERRLSSPDVDDLVYLAIHHLWIVVNGALDDPEKNAQDLHPERALLKAVKVAVEMGYPRARSAGA